MLPAACIHICSSNPALIPLSAHVNRPALDPFPARAVHWPQSLICGEESIIHCIDDNDGEYYYYQLALRRNLESILQGVCRSWDVLQGEQDLSLLVTQGQARCRALPELPTVLLSLQPCLLRLSRELPQVLIVKMPRLARKGGCRIDHITSQLQSSFRCVFV